VLQLGASIPAAVPGNIKRQHLVYTRGVPRNPVQDRYRQFRRPRRSPSENSYCGFNKNALSALVYPGIGAMGLSVLGAAFRGGGG